MRVLMTICGLVLCAFAGTAQADGWHHHGGGWHGGVWIGAPIVIGAPYYYPYYPGYYRYGPPVVREYVYEQPAPAPVTPSAPTWYYCRESDAYYPYVQECPGGWDSVPAKPPAGGRHD